MLKAIKRFIDRLAKSNEETFQGKRLDCCDLNRDNNQNSGRQQAHTKDS